MGLIRYNERDTSMKPEKIEPTQKDFVRKNGRNIYWEYYGRQQRETVCLLNGLAMSTHSWKSFLPFLLEKHDVLLFDYLGQGRSSCEDEPYTIPSFGGHLRLILDTLNLGKIHLMGISYGGFVALDFARLYADRLHTLTLSGILLSHEVLFQLYQELSLRFYRGGSEGFDLYTHYMYEKIFGESFVRSIRDQLESMREKFHRRYEDRVHCLIRLTEAQIPFFAQLDANLEGYRRIAVPTLIIVGAEDRVILPEVQRKICSIVPNTQFKTIPDAGHVVYLEKPDTFFGELKRFITSET